MKKILALILTLIFALSLVGCTRDEVIIEEPVEEEEVMSDEIETEGTSDEEEALEDEKEEGKKENEKEESSDKEDKKPSAKPEVKPEEKPEAKPEEEAPAEEENKPEEKPAEATMGATLKAQFLTLAKGTGDINAIANTLVTNEVIQFAPGVMEIQEGYLNGFGEAEIKGFEKGVMFAPMIGTIPFIGYIFQMEEGSDIDAFVANLKANANLRWNICTSADEMHVAKSGNLVFFLMSPKSMEEEPME